MYSREFTKAPEHIVENGKAHFGTYEGVSPKFEIRGMRAPYAGIPLPTFLSKLRIKSRLSFIYDLGSYLGIATFFDFKVFGLSEMIFWNKNTGKKYSYHITLPTRRRFVPNTTNLGICACYRKAKFLKISWGRQHQHHALTFKTKGDKFRPATEGFFYSPMQDPFHQDVMFVSPSPVSTRCTATWITPMNLHGHIAVNNESVNDCDGLGAMIMNRSYFKSHTRSTMVYGLGKLKDKNIMFSIKTSVLDAADSSKYNDNILFVDQEKTALPPVYITHPFGINKKWIIQDTESMVDLSFTPSSVDSRVFNIIAFRTEYSYIYGTFEGVLLTQSGEKVILKNFPGIIYSNLVRI